MTRTRPLLALAALTLSLPGASSQSVSPLNVAEVAALLGDFHAVTVTAPAGTKRATIRVASQLGTAAQRSDLAYQGAQSLFLYDFRRPLRVMVGLAGTPIGRGKGPAPVGLPGVPPCARDQQQVILGASSASETSLSKQCMGLGDRADSNGGGRGVAQTTPPKLNVWMPVYSWYFTKRSDTSDAAFAAARKDPSGQIVWWVYFSSSATAEPPAPPLYRP